MIDLFYYIRETETERCCCNFEITINVIVYFTTMAHSIKRPHLSAQAYWEFDNSKLNTEKFDDYTIVRVFERGTSQDVNELFECYGPRVKKVILKAQELPLRARRIAETIWPDFEDLRERAVNRTMRTGTTRKFHKAYLANRDGRLQKKRSELVAGVDVSSQQHLHSA